MCVSSTRAHANVQGFPVVYRASFSFFRCLHASIGSLPLFFSLYSRLSVYTRTQMPRVDVGRVISPESKAPASGVGTLVREFLNPFLHDSSLAWPGLRLCPGLACCRLRVVERLVENRLFGPPRNSLYLHSCRPRTNVRGS